MVSTGHTFLTGSRDARGLTQHYPVKPEMENSMH
jgi:hypothetical protein